jgi:predicted aspartyl protease
MKPTVIEQSRNALISFDRRASLIVVPVTVKMEEKIWKFEFAVDTGATISLINTNAMTSLGYKQQDSIRTTHTITASKTETVYEYSLDNIMAIGLIRRNFKVISRSLPMGLGIDGLLGLNFFQNKELNIDFKLSEIRLS